MPAGAEPFGVAGEPLRQPDCVGGSDRAGQLRLHLRPGDARITAGVELHGVGDEHRALAVDVGAATLVDQIGGDDRHPGRLGDDAGDVCVKIPLRPVLGAPAVEHPVHRGHRPVGAVHERRPDVTHPGIVERCLDDVDALRQVPVGDGAFRWMHDDRHGLEFGHRMRHRRPGRPGLVTGLLVVAQRVARAGECHPHSVLRSPLGRHPVVDSWSIHRCSPLIVPGLFTVVMFYSGGVRGGGVRRSPVASNAAAKPNSAVSS